MERLSELLNLDVLGRVRGLTIPDILVTLLVSLVIGLFICFVYTKTFKGVMYSSSFVFSLLAMNLITTLVIMAVTTNLIMAFGMLGALSIVRYRTVVKEPLDLVYLFWSITIGIIIGSGLIPLAVIGSIMIGLVMFVFVNHKTNDIPYITVISCSNSEAEDQCLTIIKQETKRHIIKAKTVSKDGIELTVEVRLKNSSTDFVSLLLKVNGILNATLVSYNGDYYM